MSKPTRKTAARRPTMSAEQKAYAIARAVCEQTEADYATACTAAGLVYTRGQSEADFERVSEAREDLADKFRLYAAKDALRAAEDVMVRWSLEHGKRYAAENSPEHVADVAGLYDRARRFPAAWSKLIDIAFRLAA